MGKRWMIFVFVLLTSCLVGMEKLTLNEAALNMEKTMGQVMQRESITKPEIRLIGISVHTSYEQELDKMNGKFFPCVR